MLGFIAPALVSVPSRPFFVTPFTHAPSRVDFTALPEFRFAALQPTGPSAHTFSMGDQGRAFGSDDKDYQHSKRTLIQTWQPLGETNNTSPPAHPFVATERSTGSSKPI